MSSVNQQKQQTGMYMYCNVSFRQFCLISLKCQRRGTLLPWLWFYPAYGGGFLGSQKPPGYVFVQPRRVRTPSPSWLYFCTAQGGGGVGVHVHAACYLLILPHTGVMSSLCGDVSSPMNPWWIYLNCTLGGSLSPPSPPLEPFLVITGFGSVIALPAAQCRQNNAQFRWQVKKLSVACVQAFLAGLGIKFGQRKSKSLMQSKILDNRIR